MKAQRILTTNILAMVSLLLFFQSCADAQSLKERNELLFEQIRNVHGVSDKQMDSIQTIFRDSGYIGQGNPAITKHPLILEA